jgi:hypothetical protein
MYDYDRIGIKFILQRRRMMEKIFDKIGVFFALMFFFGTPGMAIAKAFNPDIGIVGMLIAGFISIIIITADLW